MVEDAAALVKSNPKDLVAKISSVLTDMKELQRENESLAAKLGNSQVDRRFGKCTTSW